MGEKRGVIVVHGIGDQRPGATVEDFARHYATQVGGQVLSPGELHWHDEHSEHLVLDVAGQTPTSEAVKFPSVRHHVTTGDDNLIFSEVFWADLSPQPKGLIGSVQTFLWVLFGLRHVVREAVASNGLDRARRYLLRALQLLASVSTWFIFGPIAGINIFLLISVIIVAATFGLSDVFSIEKLLSPGLDGGFSLERFVDQNAVPLLSGLGIISAVFGFMSWRPLRRHGWPRRTLVWWIGFSGIVALAAPILNLYFSDFAVSVAQWGTPGIEELTAAAFGGVIVEFLLLIWVVVAALMAAQFIFSMLAWLVTPAYRRSIELAYTATFLIATSFWIVTTIIWMFTVQNVSSNAFVRNIADQLVTRGLDPSGFSWFVFALITVLFALIAVSRTLWRRKRGDPAIYDSGRGAARLIANPLLVIFIGCISVVGLVLTSDILLDTASAVGGVLGIQADFSQPGAVRDLVRLEHVQEFLQHISRSTLVFTGFLILILVFFLGTIETGLGLLVDVTNHFRLGKSRIIYEYQKKGVGAAMKTALFPAKSDVFPLRERIIDRIGSVVGSMIEDERVSSITIVSHSQGTVFAMMAIEGNPQMFKGRPAQLITMGSPYSHLYQHYFPGRYAGDAAIEMSGLRRWINIFRTDDFVGTEIKAGAGSQTHSGPENFPVPPRGHMGYWHDPDVLEVIWREARL